ncbi:unnamed protein product [Mytilus coruscus]|uniref:Uncharacterized protein n=1 Tax=Mytilus coruscus TaxID=42192 RepID=A0A6J8B1K3_MYTCO|nr:unnamed protein product [Mytilus coruscus]
MHKSKQSLGKRKINNNSESDTDIIDAINGGITDDIPCGRKHSNVNIIPINFDFENLVNESCSSGNITDEINIDRCIDNMDNEFNSTVKINFREFLTVSVKEYADKLRTEVGQYWHQTSASINNGSSIVRLNDRVRSLKEKWADKYRQSATRDTKELSDLDRIKQELEVLRQQTDKERPISEMDLMKKR